MDLKDAAEKHGGQAQGLGQGPGTFFDRLLWQQNEVKESKILLEIRCCCQILDCGMMTMKPVNSTHSHVVKLTMLIILSNKLF